MVHDACQYILNINALLLKTTFVLISHDWFAKFHESLSQVVVLVAFSLFISFFRPFSLLLSFSFSLSHSFSIAITFYPRPVSFTIDCCILIPSPSLSSSSNVCSFVRSACTLINKCLIYECRVAHNKFIYIE